MTMDLGTSVDVCVLGGHRLPQRTARAMSPFPGAALPPASSSLIRHVGLAGGPGPAAVQETDSKPAVCDAGTSAAAGTGKPSTLSPGQVPRPVCFRPLNLCRGTGLRKTIVPNRTRFTSVHSLLHDVASGEGPCSSLLTPWAPAPRAEVAAVVLMPRPPGPGLTGNGGVSICHQSETSEPQATVTQDILASEASPGIGMQARGGAGLGNGGHRLQRGPWAGPPDANAEARQPRGTPSCAESPLDPIVL